MRFGQSLKVRKRQRFVRRAHHAPESMLASLFLREIAAVVQDEYLHVQPMMRDGRQLLRVHHNPAVAHNSNNRTAGTEGRSYRSRQAPTHRSEPATAQQSLAGLDPERLMARLKRETNVGHD